MKKENMHLEFLYDKAFQHFKEQDQLRNAIIGFFATITGAFSIINSNLDITIFGFLAVIGIILALVLCRYKYYGEIYLITMNVMMKIWGDEESEEISENKIHEYLQKEIVAYNDNLFQKLFSADFLIFVAFNLVNSMNIYKISNHLIALISQDWPALLPQYFSVSWIGSLIITVCYLCTMIKAYHHFVLQNVKKSSPAHFSFLKFK